MKAFASDKAVRLGAEGLGDVNEGEWSYTTRVMSWLF